jgi:hypothetical protein
MLLISLGKEKLLKSRTVRWGREMKGSERVPDAGAGAVVLGVGVPHVVVTHLLLRLRALSFRVNGGARASVRVQGRRRREEMARLYSCHEVEP